MDSYREGRLHRLRAEMDRLSLDGMIITNDVNWHYLSGFTGDSGALLVGRSDIALLTDSRYTEAAAEEAAGVRVVLHGTPMEDALGREISRIGGTRWGFEADHVTVSRRAGFDRLGVELTPTEGICLRLRAWKDEIELAAIRQACAIADQAVDEVFARLRPGIREDKLARWIDERMYELGAEGKGFGFIVASGPRGSLPHGAASSRVIAAGEMVTFDIGCRVHGYHSDITRTFAVGEVSDELRRIYGVVLEAQRVGIAAVRPGAIGREVDRAARAVIEAAGYGERFGHSLGHGVGLEIHENPRLRRESDEVLEPGMVVTIEPGIYVPGLGGVRIEDTVEVTASGCQVLTPSRKELRTA